jgi:type VI secretion system protein ImpJ
VGRKNFALVGRSELAEGMIGLPVARIRADGTGHHIFDPNFIPPCIQISGSQRLTSLVRRLVEMLEAKVSSLAGMRPGPGRAMSEMAGHELTTYWLTHAVYTSLAPLRHHQDSGRAHPRELYEVLVRLAGALCTFSLEADVNDIPAYDHNDPEASFPAIERLIRGSLDVVVPESFIGVPLTLTQANLFTADLADKRTTGPGEWVLRFQSSAPTPFVITEVPRRLKVCSAEDVMRLVSDANPALTIEHLPSPPSAIAPRVGSHYFRVRREGPSWKLIKARGTVGVYIPDAFPESEVELLVIPS